MNSVSTRRLSMCHFSDESYKLPVSVQGRSDGGGVVGIYTPQNQSTLQIFYVAA